MNRYCYLQRECRMNTVRNFNRRVVCVMRRVCGGDFYYIAMYSCSQGRYYLFGEYGKFESAEAAQKTLDELAITNNWRNAELEW